MAGVTKLLDVLAYPLRSGVSVEASKRGSGIRMVNMRELFAHRRLGDVAMARVDIGDVDESRYLLKVGDLLFARRSLTLEGAGQCSIVTAVNEPTTWESSILRARVNLSEADPYFLYYYFRSPAGRFAISSIATQVAAAGIKSSDLAKLELPAVSLGVQRSVSEVLGVLDDKIAANHRLVSSMEQLRKTLWVRASQGAGESPLSSHAQFVNGGAYTKGATGVGRVVIRIAELNSGIGSSTVYNDLDVPDRQIAHAGDLLMSWSGSLTAVRWHREDAIVNQHIFKVIPRDDLPVWAVACAVETKLAEFREIAAGKATTMGHIKRADLDSPVAWPEISDRLNDAGTALWDRALAAEKENLRLADTRDELLPLLMSGKITVKDAEKTVEEVV